jgi:hypothetical protein
MDTEIDFHTVSRVFYDEKKEPDTGAKVGTIYLDSSDN